MIQRAAVVHGLLCDMCFSFYCQYIIRAPLSDFRTPLVSPAESGVPFGLSTTGYEPCLAQAPTTNRIEHHSLLSKSPELGDNDMLVWLVIPVSGVSAAATQSRRDNVMLEAGAGWVLGLGFGAGLEAGSAV